MKTIYTLPLLSTTLLAIALPASAEFNLGKAIQKGIEMSQQAERRPTPRPFPVYPGQPKVKPTPPQRFQPKPTPIYQPKPSPSYKPAPSPSYKPKPSSPVRPAPMDPGKMISVLKGTSIASTAPPTISNRTTKIDPKVMPKGYEVYRMKQGRDRAEGISSPPAQTTRVKDGRPMASGESTPPPSSSRPPRVETPPPTLNYRVDSNTQLATSSVRFRKGSTELADSASYQYLQNLASALQDQSLMAHRFVVEGHASADGSDYANLLLSQRRANSIFDFLMSQGVSPERLLAVGHGESHARFRSGDPEYLLAQDRQVVVFKLAD
ncbi:MAG: OmpA family protein [Verrucomicrobiales bacterium]|nr:OmpA family protein [Verrucomicrobiales bacterium]